MNFVNELDVHQRKMLPSELLEVAKSLQLVCMDFSYKKPFCICLVEFDGVGSP